MEHRSSNLLSSISPSQTCTVDNITESLSKKLNGTNGVDKSDPESIQQDFEILSQYLDHQSLLKGNLLEFQTLQYPLYTGQATVTRFFDTAHQRFIAKKVLDCSKPENDEKAKKELTILLKIISSKNHKLLNVYKIIYIPLQKVEIHMEYGIGTLRDIQEFIEENKIIYDTLLDDLQFFLTEQVAELVKIGIRHDDIHSGNILFRQDFTIMLSDFDKCNNPSSYSNKADFKSLIEDFENILHISEEIIPKQDFYKKFFVHRAANLHASLSHEEIRPIINHFLGNLASEELRVIAQEKLEKIKERSDEEVINPSEIIQYYEILAKALRDQRRFQEALCVIEEATATMKELSEHHQTEYMIMFTILKGDISYEKKEIKDAFNFYKQAEKLNSVPKDANFHAQIIARLANCLPNDKDSIRNSIVYYEKAAEIYKQKSNKTQEITMLLRVISALTRCDGKLKEIKSKTEYCENNIDKGDASQNRLELIFFKTYLNSRLAKPEAFEQCFNEYKTLYLKTNPHLKEDCQPLQDREIEFLFKIIRSLTITDNWERAKLYIKRLEVLTPPEDKDYNNVQTLKKALNNKKPISYLQPTPEEQELLKTNQEK